MRLAATCFSWRCVAALRATACGGTELEEAPALGGERQVEQFESYAYRETDAFGYQTGRCIDFHACGTYVNDSNCDGRFLPELIEMEGGAAGRLFTRSQ